MTAKNKAFLDMAGIMSSLSPCSRAKVGAIIVRGDVPVVSSFIEKFHRLTQFTGIEN